MIRYTRLIAISLLAIFLSGFPARLMPIQAANAAQTKTERNQVTVWVNTNSGVYHCPGTRWYGKTKQGEYMGECAAIKGGNRPAYGKSCGSPCS